MRYRIMSVNCFSGGTGVEMTDINERVDNNKQ